MTLAEVERAVESKKRVQKMEAREKANFDYILADLIGRSISRIYSSSAEMPNIADIYPSIFDKEEVEEAIQEKKNELFAARLKQFAQSHNKKIEEVAKVIE